MDINEFANFLLNLVDGMGLPTYQQMENNSNISPYVFDIDVPDQEYIPDSGGTDGGFKSLHNRNPAWFGVAVNNNYDISTRNMDFRYISTRETTLALVYAHDIHYPKEPPKNAVAIMQSIMNEVSDNVITRVSPNGTAANFLNDLRNGIKNYRYCLFWEFSHGGEGEITLAGDLDVNQFIGVLATARNRIFGMMDSCHSESMIVSNNIGGQSNYMSVTYQNEYIKPTQWDNRGSNPLFKSAGPQNRENIVDQVMTGLEEEFKNGVKKLPMSYAPTVNPADKPIIMLWSCTGRTHYGWYYPTSNTVFAKAFETAWDAYRNYRYVNKGEGSGMWPKVNRDGRDHGGPGDDINACMPCMRTYEPNDPDHKFVYLFSMR